MPEIALRCPSVLTRQDVFVSVFLDVLLLLPGVGGVDLLRPVFGREPPQPLRKTQANSSVLSFVTCDVPARVKLLGLHSCTGEKKSNGGRI